MDAASPSETKPRITVLAASSVDLPAHIKAIDRTARELPFAALRVLCSSVKPPKWDGEWREIGPLKNIGDYNQFIMTRLIEFVPTDFVILVQADGYGVHGDNWDDVFLNYDYIGAPWPIWCSRSLVSRVGNGGFSLRSKKWLQTCAALGWNGKDPEDWYCCVKERKFFESRGCKIAPVRVARKFAHEHTLASSPFWKDRHSFGIHGRLHTNPVKKLANRLLRKQPVKAR